MPKLNVSLLEGRPILDVRSYARRGPRHRDRLSPAEIAQISRTVRRAPEAVVKVLPRDSNKLASISRHIGYIGRHGDIELETDDGERLSGKGIGRQLLEDWDLDLDEHRGQNNLVGGLGRKPPKLVHKLMFSMPPGTPAEGVLAAARNFLREEFALKHRYVFALHTDEPHPHVHAVVKAVSEQGIRLNVRKATLREWRREFARHLRAQGIEANATERAVRGESRTHKLDGIYRATCRGASTHTRERAEIVAKEFEGGSDTQDTHAFQARSPEIRHRLDPPSPIYVAPGLLPAAEIEGGCMTYARKTQVSLCDTPYYHVVSRCVRRAWLWGVDEYAGKDYSHRKGWVLERLAQLAGVFAIDVCAYAVMSNHYHLVLHVDLRRARSWSAPQVIERWAALFSCPQLIDRWRQGLCCEAERELAEAIIERWRFRLCDVSWYMRCLNEHLARRANAEDQCKGRFWEGRFKSQALLDEAGLLTAMAYVDLNPIRAGIAATPEASEFTSIQTRLLSVATSLRKEQGADVTTLGSASVPLYPFADRSASHTHGIPYRILDYLELVDWTGCAIREDKRGAIDRRLPSILNRLNIDKIAWQQAMQPAGNLFGRAMGQLDHLRLHAWLLKQSWVRGLGQAASLYRRNA